MLFRDIIAIDCVLHNKHINTLNEQNASQPTEYCSMPVYCCNDDDDDDSNNTNNNDNSNN